MNFLVWNVDLPAASATTTAHSISRISRGIMLRNMSWLSCMPLQQMRKFKTVQRHQRHRITHTQTASLQSVDSVRVVLHLGLQSAAWPCSRRCFGDALCVTCMYRISTLRLHCGFVEHSVATLTCHGSTCSTRRSGPGPSSSSSVELWMTSPGGW